MSLACHKKSYLICVEFLNFLIFEILCNIYFDWFQCTKLRQPTEGSDSCLKINKYYVIFVNWTMWHIPNSFFYGKPGTLKKILKKNLECLKNWMQLHKLLAPIEDCATGLPGQTACMVGHSVWDSATWGNIIHIFFCLIWYLKLVSPLVT